MQALFCNVCTPGRVKPTNPCPLTYAGFQSLKRFQSFSTPLAISHGLHKPGRGATGVIYSWQRCHQFLSSSRWWCGKEFTSDGPRWLVRNQSAPEVAATEHYYKVKLPLAHTYTSNTEEYLGGLQHIQPRFSLKTLHWNRRITKWNQIAMVAHNMKQVH